MTPIRGALLLVGAITGGVPACSPPPADPPSRTSPSAPASSTAAEAPPESASTQAPAGPRADEQAGLRVSLDHLRRDGNGDLRLGFVLRNVGQAPVYVYERWNSWGAFQWTLTLEESDGTEIVAKNPQQAWTRNFPSAVMIEPGKEHRLECLVVSKQPRDREAGVDVFVAARPLRLPVRMKGVFEAAVDTKVDLVGLHGAQRSIRGSETWAGHLETAWIDLK